MSGGIGLSVIRTDKWLVEAYDRPLEICGNLSGLFNGADASMIYDYLLLHGMYTPFTNGEKRIKRLQEKDVWGMVQQEAQFLRDMWEGPDIPIFIFPSDHTNEIIMKEFNGRSGLAFKDKLFLFLSEENEEEEIKSLLTHEYNHVCRLYHYPLQEDSYTLLDTIILEGLAEHAVRERYGEDYLAAWTSLYPDEKVREMWETCFEPNRTILKSDRKHHQLLYGSSLGHKMAGYAVGYYLVKAYMERHRFTTKELLSTESVQFLL